MATPSASESGRLRRGLRTSPAVKVTLFQASEENSEPTMATPTSRTESKFQPALRQKSVKLLATAAGLRPTRKPAPTRPSSAPILANVKTFCTMAPVRMPRVLLQVRKHDDDDGQQLLRGDADARRCPPGSSASQIQGKKTPVYLAKATATAAMVPVWITRNMRPAVEESAQRAEGFAQVDVLPAGVRHGGGQFAVAQRGDQGERRGDHPGHDQQARRLHLARDIGGHDEDARADHRAHHQRGGVDQAEAFDQAVFHELLPFFHPFSQGVSRGRVGKQVGDHGHRIGAGPQYVDCVFLRDAADGNQRLFDQRRGSGGPLRLRSRGPDCAWRRWRRPGRAPRNPPVRRRPRRVAPRCGWRIRSPHPGPSDRRASRGGRSSWPTCSPASSSRAKSARSLTTRAAPASRQRRATVRADSKKPRLQCPLWRICRMPAPPSRKAAAAVSSAIARAFERFRIENRVDPGKPH